MQRPVPHFISSRLEGIKADKYGPKPTTLANSFCAYRRRKRTNSSPSGRVRSSSTKFSPVGRTACVMHQTTDSSRTHGTRPDSEDCTPSAELCVLSPIFVYFLKIYPPHFFLFFLYIALNALSALRPHTPATLCVFSIPGGFLHRSLI